MTAPNTAPITGRMKPSARIVFFPDSGLSLRLPLDMRDSTLTTAPVAPPSDGEHRRRVERAGADRDDRGRDRREHEERQHAEQVLELRLALGRLAVVRLRLRELALERLDLRGVRAERLVGLAGDDVELALVERAEQRRDHAEDHPHADLARLRREELERLVVQVEAVEEDLLRLPVRGVAERRLDVDRRARRPAPGRRSAVQRRYQGWRRFRCRRSASGESSSSGWVSSGGSRSWMPSGGGPLIVASGTPSGAPAAWPMSVRTAATRMCRQKYAVTMPLRGSANASSRPGKIVLELAIAARPGGSASAMLNQALATSWNVTVPRQWV